MGHSIERKVLTLAVVVAGFIVAAWAPVVDAGHAGTVVLVGDPTPGDDGAPPFACGRPQNPCDTVQNGVVHANPGDTVRVRAGTYTEQVVVDKTLRLLGAGALSTIIEAPAVLALETDGDGTSIVEITGVGVEVLMRGFTVRGPLAAVTSAVHVHGGAEATIRDNIVQGVDPLSGTLVGHGITVGTSLDDDEDAPAAATIRDNQVSGFHRAGIVVAGPGNRATIRNNLVTGAGPSALTTQQGITIQDGAEGDILENTVAELAFLGPVPVTAVGIFLFDSEHGIRIRANVVTNAQTGILLQATEDILILRNQVTDAAGGAGVEKGVWLVGRGAMSLGCEGGDGVTPGEGCATSATLRRNVLQGAGTGAGVVVGKPPELPFEPAPSQAVLRMNDITGWETPVLVLPTGSVVTQTSWGAESSAVAAAALSGGGVKRSCSAPPCF